jgi:glutathione S-transferase
VLELVDGTCIAETVAICRYLESLAPEPNLFGRDALEIALIEAYHRHIEFELHTNIGAAWVNGPIVAAAGLVEPIEAQRLRGAGLTRKYYQRMDKGTGRTQLCRGRALYCRRYIRLVYDRLCSRHG